MGKDINYKIPDDNTTLKQKQNAKWYRNAYDYYIERSGSLYTKSLTEKRLKNANGDISYEDYENILQPITDKREPLVLPGKIKNIDFITPLKEKNLGEYMELLYNAIVSVKDREALLRKKSKLREVIRPLVAQEIVNRLNQAGFQTGVPNQPDIDIQEVIKDKVDEYTDDKAVKYQHLLNYINEINDFDIFKTNGFFYWWATEEVYAHRYIQNGEVIKELLSPMSVFPIDSGEDFVKDMVACVVRQRIPLSKMLHKYEDKLTSSQKTELTNMVSNGLSSSSTEYYITQLFDNTIKTSRFGDNAEQGQYLFSNSDEAWETIITFVTNEPVYILKYINQLGDLVERIVESDYKVNVELGDISVDKIWKPKTYIGYKLGDFDVTAIYLKPEPVEVQIYSKTGYPVLPINGKIGLLKGNSINPIASRIAKYQAFYNVLNVFIEREIAKYKGTIELIPKSLLSDGEGSDIKGKYFYKKADGTIIWDDSRTELINVIQGYRIIGDQFTYNYIASLINLRDKVKEEASEAANMNDARFGNSTPSQSVTNNNQNLFRAKLGSTLMISMYNKFLETEHQLDLEYARVAYIEGKDFSFTDPTTGDRKSVV